MIQASTPFFYAVHPSWADEISRMASDMSLLKDIRNTALAAYMGTALDHVPTSYSAEDVYQISDREFYSWTDDVRYNLADNGKRIALIPLRGLLMSDSLGDDYQNVVDRIKSAEKEAYAGALIIADSPGGMTKGMRKLNAAIASYSKPIGVWVSGNLNSAAAYVTAPADFIHADPMEDNSFGSIGVYAMHFNTAKQIENEGVKVKITRNKGATDKAKPNTFEEWTDEDLVKIQALVDKDGDDFHRVMSSQRGLTAAQLKEVKKGGEYRGVEAFAQGLHDGTASMEESINRVSNFKSKLFI
jgi:ClpP class serine protease